MEGTANEKNEGQNMQNTWEENLKRVVLASGNLVAGLSLKDEFLDVRDHPPRPAAAAWVPAPTKCVLHRNSSLDLPMGSLHIDLAGSEIY